MIFYQRLLPLATACLYLSVINPAFGEPEQKRPNIIFILADDLGMQNVGFMGSQYFETPHLDSLAAESLVFEQAYMYPTCSPSRAALLTGKQSFRTECYTVPVLEKGNSNDNIFSKWTVGTEHPAYSKPLNEAGYKLIHLGKWHIVGPTPEKETGFPLKKKLTQPKNGNLSWLPSHQSPEIQKFYPIGRGFHFKRRRPTNRTRRQTQEQEKLEERNRSLRDHDSIARREHQTNHRLSRRSGTA